MLSEQVADARHNVWPLLGTPNSFPSSRRISYPCAVVLVHGVVSVNISTYSDISPSSIVLYSKLFKPHTLPCRGHGDPRLQ